MLPPNVLPLEARQASWSRLWEQLLSDPLRDNEPQPNQERVDVADDHPDDEETVA
jgi:hypothetical protein